MKTQAVSINDDTSSKKLKVFHLLSNPGIGGAESGIRLTVGLYPAHRMSGLIVNCGPCKTPDAWWSQHGAKYVHYPQKVPSLGCAVKLFKFLRAERPDVVDLVGLRMNIMGRIVAKLAGVPVVVSAVRQTDDWRRWYHVWLDRLTSLFVDCYVSNSLAGYEVCGCREGIPANKRTIIYNGVDLDAFTTDRSRKDILSSLEIEDENVFVFLSAAGFRYEKGHGVLVRAIAEFRDELSGCLFLFAGEGEYREQTEELARELGVYDMIRFLGLRKDVPILLNAANAFVLPSFFEGLPRSIAEAMAVGLPVIATRVSGTPELVDEGVSGILVTARDARELGRALVKLKTNPTLAEQMGQAGLQRVRNLFDIKKIVAQTEALYRRLLSKKASRK